MTVETHSQSAFKISKQKYSMDSARIRLEEGMQKELIENAKNKIGVTWKELAMKFGVCENYLQNELRKEKRTLKANIYEKLIEIVGEEYDSKIKEILNENWGRAKGGKNSVFKPLKPKLLLNSKSEELAEFVGIILGDGNIYEKPQKSIYQTRIFGNSKDDYIYITQHVPRLFQKLFQITPEIYFKEKKRVAILSKQSKDLCFTLKWFGLKNGDKRINGASFPNWIFENEEYLKACIRGLIDTDGSVYPKTRKHKTPTIWFSSASPFLRNDFAKALKILGYRVSKWTERKNSLCQSCSIGNSEDVIKYYKEIGFSNPKHSERFKKFCYAPVV